MRRFPISYFGDFGGVPGPVTGTFLGEPGGKALGVPGCLAASTCRFEFANAWSRVAAGWFSMILGGGWLSALGLF
jgi:hypothetical protein